MEKYLIKRKASLNARNTQNETPLHLAVITGNVKMMKYLLNMDADVNCQTQNGNTPLHYAIYSKNMEIVKILLINGAKINIRKKNDSPLVLAVKNNFLDGVKLLLEYGTDDNYKINMYAALLSASFWRNCVAGDIATDIEEILLDYLVDVQSSRWGEELYVPVFCREDTKKKFSAKIIAKLRTSMEFVCQESLRFIESCSNAKMFYETCLHEFVLMKKTSFDDEYNITYYDILMKDVEKLVMYAKCKKVTEAFEEENYKKKFPIYANILRRRYKIGKDKKELLEAAGDGFSSLFQLNSSEANVRTRNFLILAELFQRKMLQFLSISDLRNLSQLSNS